MNTETTTTSPSVTELEREHPRIRDIALVDGTYLVEAGRIAAIVAELADDGVRAFFAPAPADEEEPWKS